MANTTSLAKSLSYKKIAGFVDLTEEETKQKMKELAQSDTVLCSVAGEVTGYTIKSTAYGPNIGFTGNFVVRSEITGEVFESTKMFFDKAFSEIIQGRFDKRAENAEGVSFSCSVAVVKHNKAPFFTYMVTPLRTPEAISKRDALLATLDSAPKVAQLAAPVKTAKK